MFLGSQIQYWRNKLRLHPVHSWHKPLLRKRLFILFILFVVFIGCSSGEPDQRVAALKAPEKVPDKTEFSVQKVSVKEMTDTVSAVGMAQAYQEVDVSPEITGKIIKIYCDVGDSVLQGKVLAEIDDESRVISLEKKRALLRKAEATKNKIRTFIKAANFLRKGLSQIPSLMTSSLSSKLPMLSLPWPVPRSGQLKRNCRIPRSLLPLTAK